ncbi:uncharacterized protein TRUGW13939_11828 [Talaromyces rugulosus]|uniref:Uncharacterized protein n=1 Tax=Talaromyces rugulosus TaxID=121627 RepID=A0A7H8RDT6_TALRU|nr:uncharacterized protein TRUGW13939_11828 [Talaromyces rugulosus]QKX64652.1 hypothetical protein TRUGW13939_11828 [Talaromyces rugulosus]
MENRSFFIEATLMRVKNIFDLTLDIINDLQSLPGKKIVIRRFPISPIDMNKWIEENGLPKGLEYDITENSISLKVEEDAIGKAIRMAFQEDFFPVVIDKLHQHLPQETFSTSYNEPHILDGEFDGDLVCSDGQIDQEGSPAPRIVVLIGPGNEIVHGANKWIRGGGKKTKFVLGVEVRERAPVGWCPWDLEVQEIAEMDLQDLTNAIIDYHKKEKKPIVGVIKLRLFVITKNELGLSESELVPAWTCTFGPKESYEDALGNFVPSGIRSHLNPRMLSIKLPGEIEVALPFVEIKERVKGAIEEAERGRALVMATEGLNYTIMTLRGGPVVPPFPV